MASPSPLAPRLHRREYQAQTPAQVRATLPANKDAVAFQCRNPIHRAHYELFVRALDAPNVGEGAVVLVHPTMGPTQEDDISGLIRYRTYEVLKEETNNPAIRWAYLPYSMHMAGPREAIQHMIIRKNYGCTHFIIGRDMAGCKARGADVAWGRLGGVRGRRRGSEWDAWWCLVDGWAGAFRCVTTSAGTALPSPGVAP